MHHRIIDDPPQDVCPGAPRPAGSEPAGVPHRPIPGAPDRQLLNEYETVD